MKLLVKSIEWDNDNEIISYTLSSGKTISVAEYKKMVETGEL